MGSTITFIDLTPSGACNITGLIAGFDGQFVTITNLSATISLTLDALNAGSTSTNQFRLVGNLALGQYNSASFRYSATIGHWISV
jgi:hypothetical protein